MINHAVIRTAVVVGLAFLGVACREDFSDHVDPATFRSTYKLVVEGTIADSETVDPAAFLARTKREGGRVAQRVGVRQIAEALESWTEYQRRGLIVVLGGSQAHQEIGLTVERLDAPAFSSLLIVWASLEQASEPLSAVRSVPWVVVSAPAQDVFPTEECVLRLGGPAGTETRTRCVLRASDQAPDASR